MSLLGSLSIRYKILSIVAIAVLGFVASLAFNYTVTGRNAERLHNVRDVYYPTLEGINTNQVRLDRIKESLNAAVGAAEMDLVEDSDAIAGEVKNAFTELAKLSSEQSGGIEHLQILFDTYYSTARKLTVGMVEGTLQAADMKSLAESMRKALNELEVVLTTFRDASHERFSENIQAANDDSEMALRVGLAISLLVIVVVGLTGFAVSAVISKDIRNVVSSLQDMSHGDGDLTVRLETSSKDEIGQLVESFNTFVGKLQGMMGEIAGSVAQLASAAEELSAVSSESNENVDKQQAETGQVATAMNEMTTTVQEVACNATQTAEAANKANTETDSGRQIVTKTIESITELASEVETAAITIQQLESDSENIDSVVDVIRGISEQTNLLALNAAIEAARAGEQGRGFAVVADEVRTLASRTQESTLEIQSMIESLQTGAARAVEVMEQGRNKAQGSVENAARAGESLNVITSTVATISDMNTQIASAAEEQTAVAEEINRNIANISLLGDQTSEGARQTAASSEEMAQLAVQLQGLVGQFKV